MAAPHKKGLDYFPLDCNVFTDRKLRKAKMRFGHLAIAVYLQLLCLIYKDKGYYLDYSDPDDVVWDVLETLQGKYQPTPEIVAEVIECLVACELFSGDQFNHKTITSTRVQSTYYSATSDRKSVDVDFDKWLLSQSEMETLSTKSIILQNFVNRSDNSVNRSDNSVNRSDNPQSKVKESKVNKSRVEESNTAIPTLEEVQACCKGKAVNAERFYLYYQGRGWKIGNTPITNWKAMVDIWDIKDRQQKPQSTSSFDIDLLDRMLDVVPNIHD